MSLNNGIFPKLCRSLFKLIFVDSCLATVNHQRILYIFILFFLRLIFYLTIKVLWRIQVILAIIKFYKSVYSQNFIAIVNTGRNPWLIFEYRPFRSKCVIHGSNIWFEAIKLWLIKLFQIVRLTLIFHNWILHGALVINWYASVMICWIIFLLLIILP